ncbi:MAG: GTPase HflX [Candidatus Cloacimonas sp.]|nr:GTPase HflX [Candidatus Cloacimonadota bacterium]
MESTKKVKERVFIIGLYTGKEDKQEYENTIAELEHLCKTADAQVIDVFVQQLDKPNASTYIGKGKIEEIKERTKEDEVDTLIFNDNLSPAQARNIARITECNIVDRTELILDIFATHAKTKQAKMQVELAILQYNYSKLRNLWQHFSRIEGGIGTRGPGETQIELDRREIQKKISKLKERIKEVEKVSVVKRKKRKQFENVALVGYTNAGKSTLFNRLTGEQRYVANKLFATLDSTTRALDTKESDRIVLSDTVGFIRKLPHTLVSSFHSTLLEVTEADLLLHVVDVSQPDIEAYINSVNEVLKELGADNKEILYVFNKFDSLEDNIQKKMLKKSLELKYHNTIFISAKYDQDFDELKEMIVQLLRESKKESVVRIPTELKNLLSYIESDIDIVMREFDQLTIEHVITIRASKEDTKNIIKQIEEYKLKKYINE